MHGSQCRNKGSDREVLNRRETKHSKHERQTTQMRLSETMHNPDIFDLRHEKLLDNKPLSMEDEYVCNWLAQTDRQGLWQLNENDQVADCGMTSDRPNPAHTEVYLQVKLRVLEI